MKNLEFCYNQPLRTIKFINRKQFITAPKTLIISSGGSGKTALICEYLSQFKQNERLYINLSDMRLERANVIENLGEFLRQNTSIKVLAIDNARVSELESLAKINSKISLEVFLVSTSELLAQNVSLQGFALLNLPYLDYEEFIAFFRKTLEPDMLFSHFLAHGNAPKSAFLDASEVNENLQKELAATYDTTSIAVLKTLALKCSECVSAYEIYKTLKEYTKISKDSVYATLSYLENNGIIAGISMLSQPNMPRKIFFTNFALRNALTTKKEFAKIFSNVIFCELAKFKDEIYYTKEFDFFLTKRKLAIICMPFLPNDIIFLKFKKLHTILKNLGAGKLQIISVANTGEMAIEGIKCEILPFSRWALGN